MGFPVCNLFYQYLLSAPPHPKKGRLLLFVGEAGSHCLAMKGDLIKTPVPRVPQARGWVGGLSTHSLGTEPYFLCFATESSD